MAWAERIARVEPVGDRRMLLLIVDVPTSANELDVVVYRRSFSQREIPEMEKIKARYMSQVSRKSVGLPKSNVPVWPITRMWTEQDESDYSDWIRINATMTFLKGTGIYVDCADHAIAMRWIFAHARGLPAANTLAGSKRLYGSWQTAVEWETLPTHPDWRLDERFKAALKYLLKTVYTQSLPADLYPIAITPELLTPGTVYLTLTEETGHARTILNIQPGVGINIIWGNEPATEIVYTSDLIPLPVKAGRGGFLRQRWPELQVDGKWLLRAPELMPGYSNEQFEWPESDYLLNISDRLGLWTSTEDRYVNLGNSIVGAIKSRFGLTAQGYFQCSLVKCLPEDPLYNEWSTPSRDKRLLDELATFRRLTAGVDRRDRKVVEFNQDNGIPAFPGAPFTHVTILNGNLASTFSSDPTASLFERWGISKIGIEDALTMLAQSAFENWKAREELVQAAQTLCFQNGSNVCDPLAPEVVKLSSARVDEAFRVFQRGFTAQYMKATKSVRGKIDFKLALMRTNVPKCPANRDSLCTLREYLLTQPLWLQKISSDPTAPLDSRNGI